MTIRRQRRDIYAAILKFCNEKTQLKTHIMYQCNLSYSQTPKLITELLNLGFLRKSQKLHRNHSRICFNTTKKGNLWLTTLQQAMKLEGGEIKHEKEEQQEKGEQQKS